MTKVYKANWHLKNNEKNLKKNQENFEMLLPYLMFIDSSISDKRLFFKSTFLFKVNVLHVLQCDELSKLFLIVQQ